MTPSTLLDVVLVGFAGPPESADARAESLARVFGIDVVRAAQVVASAPIVVRHAATSEEARRYGDALRRIGATVQFVKGAAEAPLLFEEGRPAAPQGALAFLRRLPGAFAYPFRGRGVLILALGTLFFAGATYLASFSIFGFVISFFLAGYLCCFMVKVVAASASGEDEPPEWPDFSSFMDDIIWPYVRMIAAVLCCFVPAVLPLLLLDGPNALAVALALVGLGALLLPMAILSVSLFRTVGGLSPLVIGRGVLATWRCYLIAVATMALLLAVVTAVLSIPAVGLVIGTFLSIWLSMVEMRILGLLYRTHADRLDWI